MSDEEERYFLTYQGDCYGTRRLGKPGEENNYPFIQKTNFRIRLIALVAAEGWPKQKFHCEVTLKERLRSPRKV